MTSPRSFANLGQPFRYPKDRVIFVQRDHATKLYLVVEGIVKLSIFTDQGDERIIEFIKPERFLGAPDIFSGSLYGITAIAYTNALITSFTAEEAKKLFAQDQQFAVCLAKSISQHARSLGRLLVGDSFFPATGRIGFALLNLAVQIGNQMEGTAVKLGITHHEIAKYVGCNRITVTNVLSDLSAAGLIEKRNKFLVISDAEALRTWVDQIIHV